MSAGAAWTVRIRTRAQRCFTAKTRQLSDATFRRYYNQKSVGAAIRASAVPRRSLFVLSKVGPTFPLGYNDTLQQVTCDRHVSCHHCA